MEADESANSYLNPRRHPAKFEQDLTQSQQDAKIYSFSLRLCAFALKNLGQKQSKEKGATHGVQAKVVRITLFPHPN
jgi:hypothetical protein